MLVYKTKKDLLIDMGMHPRNTKYVDKLIERWKVREVDGGYKLWSEEEWISNVELEKIKCERDEYKVNMEYYRDRYLELKDEYNWFDERKRNWVWRKFKKDVHISEDQYDDFCEWWETL